MQIYCTSNRDGTGTCWDDKTGRGVNCVAIPGETIACSDPQMAKLNCIAVGYMLFSCYPGNKEVIMENFGNAIDPRGTFGDRLDQRKNEQPQIIDPNRVITPGINGNPIQGDGQDELDKSMPSQF